MNWKGSFECSTDGCDAKVTHVAWSDHCGPTIWCAYCVDSFRSAPGNWHVEQLPDFADLCREAETLTKVRDIVERYLDDYAAVSAMQALCRELGMGDAEDRGEFNATD